MHPSISEQTVPSASLSQSIAAGEEEKPDASLASDEIELSIVMPCLNEAETVGVCVAKAAEWLRSNRVKGEVIVADNGSTDVSQGIAQAAGARGVGIARRGQGSALMGGIDISSGKLLVMGDA